jgi:TRAP transporter TAXI family solute receptor
MKKKITLFALGLLVAVLIVGASPAGAKVKFIQITSGPVGGTYYILGGALADLLKDAVEGIKVTVTTGGSLANISKVQSGKADVGFTMNRLVYEARNGIGSYKDKGMHDNIMGLAYLCDIYMSLFLVPEKFPVNSIQEIKDQKTKIRILTSPRASSPSVAAERMLEAYGITFKDIEDWGGKVNFVSYSEAANLLKDGHADVWLGPMVPPILEWTVSKDVKFLPIKQPVLDALKEKHKYGIATVPAGYWEFVKKPTPIMTESIMITVSKKLPEDMVYAITKTISEHPDVVRKVHRLYEPYDPKRGCEITGGPMHPGAVRYYKEAGIPCQ